ncbi:MAG TPA: hypothetical protein VGH84_09355 [Steroidobacteraceae bacterium]
MAQYQGITYPSGRVVQYDLGTGMHDMSGILNGNGWTQATITAHAGGTRPLATPINCALTLIAVCATAADSCMLPPAMGGQIIWIANGGAASSQIFANAAGSDTINGVVAATGIALANGKSITLFSPLPGAWFGILSA